MSFNPRARKGRDGDVVEGAFKVKVFQSTRPQGARQALVEGLNKYYEFQSTRPQGARQLLTS